LLAAHPPSITVTRGDCAGAHLIVGISLEELIEQDFGWQEGWEYQLS
jgi:hypothetical protein